ncbi:MAG: hypothetical protein ACOY3M_00370 [Patescibacteria group bacterium]
MSLLKDHQQPQNEPDRVLSLIPGIVHGGYSATEKYAFAARRNGDHRIEIQPDSGNPIFSRGIFWFFDRLGIPYKKLGPLAPPNSALKLGASYCIVEPVGKHTRFWFRGILDKEDRRTQRPTESGVFLDFDTPIAASILTDSLKHGNLDKVLFPVLAEYFSIGASDMQENLFMVNRRHLNILQSEKDPYSIPMASLVIGRRTMNRGPLAIIHDTRDEKQFVDQKFADVEYT